MKTQPDTPVNSSQVGDTGSNTGTQSQEASQAPSRKTGFQRVTKTVKGLALDLKCVSKFFLPRAVRNSDIKSIRAILNKHEVKNPKLWKYADEALLKGNAETFMVLYKKAADTVEESDKQFNVNEFKGFLTSNGGKNPSLPMLISVANQDSSLRELLRGVFIETFGKPGHESITSQISDNFNAIFTKEEASAQHLHKAAKLRNNELVKFFLKSPNFFHEGRIANEKVFTEYITVFGDRYGSEENVVRPDEQLIEFVQEQFLDMLKKGDIPYAAKLDNLLGAELEQNTDFARNLQAQINVALLKEKFDILLSQHNDFTQLPKDVQANLILQFFPGVFTSADMSPEEKTAKIYEILDRSDF